MDERTIGLAEWEVAEPSSGGLYCKNDGTKRESSKTSKKSKKGKMAFFLIQSNIQTKEESHLNVGKTLVILRFTDVFWMQ